MPSIIERPSNTTEQMRAYLDTALLVFGEADIPDDLREIAFTKLLDWAAAKSLIQEPIPMGIAVPRHG